MKRDTLNYVIDIILLISLIFVFITGLLKWPGLLKSLGFENIPWKQFKMIHDWSGLLLGIGALLHLILHRDFMACETRNLFVKN